jgi:hypothetical protein
MNLPKFNVLLAEPTEATPTPPSTRSRSSTATSCAPSSRPPSTASTTCRRPDALHHPLDLGALLRTHVITDDFRTFKPRLLAIEAVDDDEPRGPYPAGGRHQTSLLLASLAIGRLGTAAYRRRPTHHHSP